MTFSWIDSSQCNLIYNAVLAKDTKFQVFSSFDRRQEVSKLITRILLAFVYLLFR